MPANATKLNEDRITRIAKSVRNGNPFIVCIAYEGISERIFYHWMRTGRDLRQKIEDCEMNAEPRPKLRSYQKLCLKLLHVVEKADAEAAMRAQQVLQIASQGEAKWAAWWLERRRSHEFGRRLTIEQDAMDNLDVVSPSELMRRMLEATVGIQADDDQGDGADGGVAPA